ncbi:hypothetical protein GAO09_04355 [Rhizobiales bacterium RZME27]|jgi:hypothetical protein|uniref:Uncharacterized protein n=1 Tax=Endobacterium cereale TaxID=2663029 RepID=A0A6A8A3G2_9HYPH|nr:DUF6030 family protein [Endobacterium cereale]MEB2848335.1 DUF6030 family protein [Endobacterium cereale]MQY45299.1 hypothetical protein [Endobacterium cereale]
MAQDKDDNDRRSDGLMLAKAVERYPQRHPGRRIVMMLFVCVAICAVTIPVLLANNGRNLEMLGDRLGLPLNDWWRGKTDRVDLPKPPQGLEPPVVDNTAVSGQRHIPAPALDSPPSHLLRPVDAWKPEESCNALQPGVTGEKPVFLAAPDGRSECTVLVALSEAEKASSLFLQIRASGGNVASLRMKLNFGEDGKTGALVERADDMAQSMLMPISEDDRAYLRGKMTERQAFRTEIGDYRMSFRPEGNDTSRFNFIAVSKVREPDVMPEEQSNPEAAPESAQP